MAYIGLVERSEAALMIVRTAPIIDKMAMIFIPIWISMQRQHVCFSSAFLKFSPAGIFVLKNIFNK